MQKYHKELEALTAQACRAEASDLLIKPGVPVSIRTGGQIIFLDFTPSQEWVTHICEYLSKTGSPGLEHDCSFTNSGGQRFRVHIYTQRSERAIALRHIRTVIPTAEDLMLPHPVANLHTLRKGLVLIAGSTGMGKSTTLAAILQQINATSATHIITLEDPIEYNFANLRSTVDQREIGIDTASFADGIKFAMRQDPDIIMVGELRDALSAEGTLQAALTGHMVLTTIHAENAAQAIPRLLNLARPDEEHRIRNLLAETLQASLCQKLVFSSRLNRLVPVFEILPASPALRSALRNKEMSQLRDILEAGGENTMTFNQHLHQLVQKKILTSEEASAHSPNPAEFSRLMRGILTSEHKRILRKT